MLLPLLLGQGTGATNYSLTCNAGSYTVTGQSATVEKDRYITCNAGSYTVTGQSITIVKKRYLTANAGSYTYTGQSATVEKDRYLTAQSGSYSVAGQDITITYVPVVTNNYAITAQAGSYTLTGQSITLSRNRVITSNSGSYTISGQSATISRNRMLAANDGSYAVVGQSASIARNRSISCLSGEYWIGDSYVNGGYWEDGYVGDVTITITAARSTASGGRPSRRRVFIEKDGEILVFDSAAAASLYLSEQKEPVKAEKKKKRKAKAPKVIKPEVLRKEYAADRGMLRVIETAVVEHDFETLFALYEKLRIWQEDEDLITLLIAA